MLVFLPLSHLLICYCFVLFCVCFQTEVKRRRRQENRERQETPELQVPKVKVTKVRLGGLTNQPTRFYRTFKPEYKKPDNRLQRGLHNRDKEEDEFLLLSLNLSTIVACYSRSFSLTCHYSLLVLLYTF